MEKTKFIRVAVEERLPKVNKDVILIYDGDKYATGFHSGTYWWIYDAECQKPEYWLEEIPDREDETLQILERAKNKFKMFKSEFGQGSELIEEIASLIQSVKQTK